MDTAQKIEIMQAFQDGLRIEYKDPCTGWREITNGIHSPSWNWERDEYRIKKAPEYFTHDIHDGETGYFIKRTVDIRALEDALKIIEDTRHALNFPKKANETYKALRKLVKSK